MMPHFQELAGESVGVILMNECVRTLLLLTFDLTVFEDDPF